MKLEIGRQTIIGVLGLAIRPGRQVLLTRRHAPGQDAWHNMWQVPGGGLEFGEHPEETVLREIQEELGARARILYPHPVVKSRVWYSAETGRAPDTQIILMTYVIDIGDARIDISGDEETNGFGWFEVDAIEDLLTLEHTVEMVREADAICSVHNLWAQV